MPEEGSASTNEAWQAPESLTARAAWILFAKTVGFGLSFALPLLLIRRLSQQDFGIYKQVFLVVGTALTMLPMGFGMSAYYFLPREVKRQGAIVFNILIYYFFAAGVACLTLFLYPQVLVLLFNDAELIPYAPLISLAILLWVVSSFLETVAIALQETRLASTFIIGAQLTKALMLVGAAAMFGTVRALIYATIVQGALQTLVLCLYLKTRFPGFWRKFDWQMMRRQLSYALPFGIAGMIFSLQMDLHNYYVANQFDPAIYALYAVGCFQLPFIDILGQSMSSVMIPRISLLQARNEPREIILLTARVMRKLAALYLPLYVFLLVMGREFITLLFTERYLDSWPIFAINLTFLPLGIVILDPIRRAYADQRYFLLGLQLAMLIAMTAIFWLGANRFGLTEIIATVVFLTMVERLVTAIRLGRVLGVRKQDYILLNDIGKVAVASLLAGACAMITRAALPPAHPFFTLVLSGTAFAVAYVVTMVLIGFVTAEERRVVQKWATWALQYAFRRRSFN